MTTTLSLAPTAPAVTSVSLPLLTRVGGLPADVMDLVGSGTREHLAGYAEAVAGLERMAPALIGTCFRLVPQLGEDVVLRRQLLAGKRALHQLKPLPWDAPTLAAVASRLGPREAERVNEWTRQTAECDRLLGELADDVARDRACAITRLYDALAHPGYLESLAMAAPDWLRHAKADRRRSESPIALKTLLFYAARASLKTSPFSGLTTVGVAGERGRARSRSRTSAVLGAQALQTLARDERTAGLLRYRIPPRRAGGPHEPNGLFLHAESMFADGMAWRDDRVVAADHAAPWLDLLASGNEGELTLAEVLNRVGSRRPFARFLRLLDSGLLHPLPPWQRGGDPLAALARTVKGVDSPIQHDELVQVYELGVGAARCGVSDRIEAGISVQQLTGTWGDRADLGEHKPSGLIYEDRESDLALPDPREIPAVMADLADLGARVRPFVFRSHIYDHLLDMFLVEFGAGGMCVDLLGFLMRLSVDRDSNPPLQRAQAADFAARADPGDRAWLPVGPTSAAPGAGVLFQIAADSHADAMRGDYELVVNNFGSGSGSLFARFSSLLGEDFRAQLVDHVDRTWGGVPCRELVVWTDCNTAQAECSGLLPALLLPGEPLGPNALTLDSVRLAHDPATDTLSLVDRRGEPFGLAYLGLTPQHLLQGYIRLLGVLADPWVNASPDSDYTVTKFQTLSACCGPDVTALPRVQHGRLVTQRASWVVPVDRLPRPGAVADEADVLVRCDEFRREHGIPEEVFAHQLGGSAVPVAGVRKPAWVSFASPLSVGVLHQWLSPQTSHLRLVEALPTRTAYPQRDAQGRRRVTEHATLLHWPRPGQE